MLVFATQNDLKPLSMEHSIKRGMTTSNSHSSKLISEATRRFAIYTPEDSKAPPKNQTVAPAELPLSAEYRYV